MSMKRVMPLALLVSILFAASAVAAPTGGLAYPTLDSGATFSVSTGYLNRDVEVGGGNDEISSRRLLFKGDFGIGNGMDVYAFLGFSDLRYKYGSFSGALGELLGAGFRYGGLTLADGSTRLVLDGQFEYFASDDDAGKAKVLSYHVAAYLVRKFGAAGKVGYFYPFGGIRLSNADGDLPGGGDFDADDHFGFFGGADYFVSPNVYFSTEMHVFDEQSIYFTVGHRF